MKFKQVFFIVIRITLGIALLFFLLWKADVQKITDIVKQVNIFSILVSIVLFLFALVVISVRWRILLKAHSVNIPFGKSLSYYLVGFFFNNFLPTILGLDMVRAIYVSNNYGKKAECFASVISEKMIGSLAILLLGVFFLPPFITKDINILYIFIGFLVLAIVFMTGVFFFPHRKRLKKFLWITKPRILRTFKNKVAGLYDAMYYYRNRKGIVFQTLLLSSVYQLILFTMVFFIARAISVSIPFYYYLAFLPVIHIGSMIPITPNGMGIREGLYVYLFRLAGVSPSESILISIIFAVIILIISISGGIIFIFGVKKSRN